MNIFCGIDVGYQSIKVLALDKSRVLGSFCLVTGSDAATGAQKAIQTLFHKLDLEMNSLSKHFVATGAGRNSLEPTWKKFSDIRCQAVGARFLHPQVRLVINVGAETCRAIKIDETGLILESVENDKCAAGSGIFIDEMSSALELTPKEAGAIALTAGRKEKITSLCAVFAESEVVSAIHRGVPREEILAGMHDAITQRIVSAAIRIKPEPDVVLTGGLANNPCIVAMVGDKLGLPLFVPENPEMVGALGAALLARKYFSPCE